MLRRWAPARPHLRSSASVRLPAVASLPSWAFLTCGVAAVALYVTGPEALTVPLFVGVVVGSIVATVVGALRNQSAGSRRAWWQVAGGEAAFFVGAILRFAWPTSGVAPNGLLGIVPDALAVVAYTLLTCALLEMLRRRRAGDDDPARIDALLIGLVAAMATWIFLIEPRFGPEAVSSRPATAFFPLADVLLLAIITQLMLANGARRPALWLLCFASSTMFLADLVYSVTYDSRYLTGQWAGVFDAVFLLAYVPVGASALHPTMRTLTEPQPVVLRPLGRLRATGIAVALMAPSALAITCPPSSIVYGAVRLVLTVLLTVTVVVRIVRSNNVAARTEEDARHRATHDALTDLPNRELLAETVADWCDRAIADGHEICLLFIDLDRFKMVNDTWGHGVGDELLCAVASRLAGVIREQDLVCRIGGDEFVIALAAPGHSSLAETLARRLITDFAAPFRLSVGEIVITPSIGVAHSNGTAEALELIRDADTAMYKAKDSGRNSYAFFDNSLREQVRTRVNLEQALRGALERGELAVHYQPIIDLQSNELDGFEALMRWFHPELGAVSPMEFIPIAEDTGLITYSGAWLLEEAVMQLARWQAQRASHLPPLHVSVNVSFRQLRDEQLVPIVRRVLDRSGLPPTALWLEITESGMMEDPERALSTLLALREIGVTLCIDDFGTGYSSLSYLKRFPVGIVKIDRSFVSGLGQDGDDEAIVRTVVAMAHALGQRVVAEGIETAVQRDWLVDLGCDLAQGWLYGAPRAATPQLPWESGSMTVADPAAQGVPPAQDAVAPVQA